MMSTHGLTVRLLASTNVAEVQQVDRSDEAVGDNHQEHDEKEQGEAGSLTGREGDDGRDMDVRGEDEDNESRERSAIPTSSSSSEDSDSDSDSDSSNDSSEVSTSGTSVTMTSCIQEAQLSPDGTCIFTTDYSRAFSVYPISTDMLRSTTTRSLSAYARFSSADPIWAFASNPLFDLQDSSSTHVLISRRDRYITLHNALWDISNTSNTTSNPTSPVDIHTPLASYKFINHLNEAVTAPLSLAYSLSSTHFFAGSQNRIALFDLTYTDDPIRIIPTIPSRRNKLKGGGRGFKGAISALSLSPVTGDILAVGARTRSIGLYDASNGSEVTHFSLPGTLLGRKSCSESLASVMGDGVSSLKWSPCGTYLYVAERDSDVLLIYDARNFSLALGYCAGRNARSKQKLGFDIWTAGEGAHEVWAGGLDGKLRVWKAPYMKEGAVEADQVVNVSGVEEEMPIVSTLVHPSGSLAVTARGGLRIGTDDGEKTGISRGGGTQPRFSESGCLDILGLSGY